MSVIVCGSVDLSGDSDPVECAGCGTALVLSPVTRRDAGPDAITVCVGCALVMVMAEPDAEHRVPVVGPETRAALARHGIFWPNDPDTS